MNGSKSHSGVRRSSDTDLASSGSSKRRKFDCLDHQNVADLDNNNKCWIESNVNSPENYVCSPVSSSNCDHVVSSSCLNKEFTLDLKAEIRLETETSISNNNEDSFREEETSASSEICLDSNEMESTSALKKKPVAVAVAATSCRKPIKVSSIPSAAEIDAFFAQAEKKEQKRFADKYNYDIVNDVPMEGRYQWIRLKQ